MEDYYKMLYFWRSFIAFLALLGVQLILLGVAVAGWGTALRKREAEAEVDQFAPRKHATSCMPDDQETIISS